MGRGRLGGKDLWEHLEMGTGWGREATAGVLLQSEDVTGAPDLEKQES